MIFMLSSLDKIQNPKNKLPAIPQAVRAQTLTLQSTFVGKKSIFMKIRIRSESCDQQIYILRWYLALASARAACGILASASFRILMIWSLSESNIKSFQVI